MIIRRVLTQGALWRVAATHPITVTAAVSERTMMMRCCAFRLSLPQPFNQRWLSASASSRAAHQPKHQPPQDGPQSSSTPLPQDAQGRESEPDSAEVDPLQDKSIGLFQRFKKTFKQYGKVMIPVHLLTSSLWFGTFYYAAMK